MTSPMTSLQRLRAALRGEAVDRVPVWLREGFPLHHGPAPADDWALGWQADPLYRELFDHVAPHADDFVRWGVPGNRYLMIPPSAIRREVVEQTPQRRVTQVTVATPSGELTSVVRTHRHEATTWVVKDLVEDVADLKKLASVPFELEPGQVEAARRSYAEAREAAAGRAMLRTFLSSPVVCISGAMPLQLFLELSVAERGWFHELCDEITRRQLAICEAVFEGVTDDTLVTFGGSEQCTPPMMRPQAYDEYVVPYEGRLVAWLRQRGLPVSIHCHGKVRHALGCMLAMGADATDPLEPPPAGDVTYAEARALVGDRLTLMGNLEWDMLETAEPAEVRRQVRAVLAHGTRRLILAASAGPISAVTRRLVDNYRTWIDTALEYGQG